MTDQGSIAFLSDTSQTVLSRMEHTDNIRRVCITRHASIGYPGVSIMVRVDLLRLNYRTAQAP